MRKHSSIFAGMMNIENFNSEKRSESVAQVVEAALNDLKISVEPSKLEMKNVLFAGVNSDKIEKMIEKYSVKPPLNLIDENEFDLYTKGHFNQAFCAAVMSYHSDCEIPAPLRWCYSFIPLAYKLAAQALHAKDLMLISRNLKLCARFYEVQSYSSKKKEFIPRSKSDPYRESITMGMVVCMLKATERAKTDFLFKMGLDSLEREYSKNIEWAPSFLPYISNAFSELANFVQTCEINNHLNKDSYIKQEQIVDLEEGSSYIRPTEIIRNVFRFPSELLYDCVSNMFEILKINKEKPSGASLALIEKVLEDHGQLYTCAEHTKFIKAVQDWGLIKITNNELISITSAVRKKYSKLDRRGYLDFKNEKDKKKCLIVASCLKEDMKYIA